MLLCGRGREGMMREKGEGQGTRTGGELNPTHVV